MRILIPFRLNFWREWADRHTVRFFNFFPDFIEIGAPPMQVIKKYFVERDVYWNETGHQLIAESFLEKLQKAYPHFFVES